MDEGIRAVFDFSTHITDVGNLAIRTSTTFWHTCGITSETTKFYLVISQLDHQYAEEVDDIIAFPPQRDPYTTPLPLWYSSDCAEEENESCFQFCSERTFFRIESKT
jgi:hypothetical protein